MRGFNIDFRRMRDISDCVNASFAFIRQEFKPFIKIIARYAAPIIIALTIMEVVNENYGKVQKESIFAFWGAGITIGDIITVVFSFFLALFLALPTLAYAKLYNEKTEIIKESVWQIIKKKTAGIFIVFISIGLIAVVAGLLLAGLAGQGQLALVIAIIAGIAAGFGFLYMLPACAMFIPVYFFESKNASGSFFRALSLMRGYWWATAVGLFVMMFVIYIAQIVFSLPGFLLKIIFQELPIINKGSEISAILMYSIDSIVFLVANVASALIAAFYLFASFHYFNLIERKEARTLFEKIETLGEDKSDSDDLTRNFAK